MKFGCTRYIKKSTCISECSLNLSAIDIGNSWYKCVWWFLGISKGSPGSPVMIHRGVLDMQVAKHQMVDVGVESIYGGKQWDFIRRIV